MDPDVFCLETEDKKFICNKETGKWVLAKDTNEDVLTTISSSPKKQSFKGTSMVVLNVSRRCNFDCIYCHVGSLKKQNTLMNLEVGKKAIDRVMEIDETNRHVVFHGSEPMTNFELIKHLVDYAREKKGNISFSMQSNGSLLKRDRVEWLTKNNVGIGISLDGLKYHQDQTRSYLEGRSTYEEVIKNLEGVRDIQKGVSVISVVTSHNVNDLEKIVLDFEKKGIRSVLFSPVSSCEGENYSPDQRAFIDKMKNTFERYIQNRISGKETIKIRNLRDFLRTFFGKKITYNCVKCGGNGKHPLIAIDIDGTLYPCDYFWGREEYSIGNIFDNTLNESFNSPNNFRIYRDIEQIEDCLSCDWKRFCGGGCPGSSVMLGKGISSKSEYCDYYREMLSFVAKKIPLLHKNHLIGELIQ